MLMQELKGAKMNWKKRLTNYNFWISMFSAMLLILQALKIEFDIAYVNEIFTAVLGLLVVIGIISDPTKVSVKSTENTQETATKVEEKVVDEKNIPNNKENEINNIDIQTDLQAILEKITQDLDEKFKELKNLKTETENSIIKKESEEKSILFEVSEEKSSSTSSEIQPAVAEMENPYVDVIN